MQQYPNYWMNNYPQQYPQPMYPNQQINQQFQQNQQMPYMDQLNQLRMQQVQPVQNQVQGLMGRLVDDFSVITANDVPMDGNGAVFIKRDGSEIQVRNWTAQGTIATNVFKPVQMEQPKELSTGAVKSEIRLSDDVVAMLRKHFEDINKRFDELEKSIAPLD